jgi:hypothetical protein
MITKEDRMVNRPMTLERAKKIVAGIRPPDFDCKTATPEQWAALSAMLSPIQREAQLFLWRA